MPLVAVATLLVILVAGVYLTGWWAALCPDGGCVTTFWSSRLAFAGPWLALCGLSGLVFLAGVRAEGLNGVALTVRSGLKSITFVTVGFVLLVGGLTLYNQQLGEPSWPAHTTWIPEAVVGSFVGILTIVYESGRIVVRVRRPPMIDGLPPHHA